MFKEVKCLSCQNTLYRIGPLDERGMMWGVYEGDKDRYDSIRKGLPEAEYFECSHCKKKNWIQGKKVKDKGLQEWISHATD